MDTLDLDINNYNIKDIEKFFRLKPNQKYNASDIELKEYEIREQLLKSGHVNKRFKSDLIEFLTKAKQWLIFVKCGKTIAEKQPSTIPKNYKLDTLDTPISKEHPTRTDELINHPERQFIYANPSEFFQGTLNPLNTRVLTKTLNIDTRFRDNLYTTQCSDFNMNIPNKLNKVVSMQLSSIELPIVFYNISESFGNNYLYIKVNYNTFPFQNNCLIKLLENQKKLNNSLNYTSSDDSISIDSDDSISIDSDYSDDSISIDSDSDESDDVLSIDSYNALIIDSDDSIENDEYEYNNLNNTSDEDDKSSNEDVESITDIIDEQITNNNIDTYLNNDLLNDEEKIILIDEELDIKNEKDEIKHLVQYEKMQNKIEEENFKKLIKIEREKYEILKQLQEKQFEKIKKNEEKRFEKIKNFEEKRFEKIKIFEEKRFEKNKKREKKKCKKLKKLKKRQAKKCKKLKRLQVKKFKKLNKLQVKKCKRTKKNELKKRIRIKKIEAKKFKKRDNLIEDAINDNRITTMIDEEMMETLNEKEKDLIKGIEDEIFIIIPDGNYNSHGLINTINNLLSPIDEDGNLMNPNSIFSYIELSLDIDSNNSGTGKVIIKPSKSHAKYINSITLDFTKNLNGTSDTTSLFSKIGWNLGFIKPQYAGSKQYISDTVFEMSTIKYIYLAVDDFNNNVNNQFVSLFNKSILNPNILARISIKGTSFSSIKENNYTIITEPRKYFGPVDIQRLRIQLYDEYGRVLNMNNSNYSFCLDFKLLYDL